MITVTISSLQFANLDDFVKWADSVPSDVSEQLKEEIDTELTKRFDQVASEIAGRLEDFDLEYDGPNVQDGKLIIECTTDRGSFIDVQLVVG